MTQSLRVIEGGRADESVPEESHVPPHDLELEASVVGTAMKQPDLLPDIATIVQPPDMFSDAHRLMFVVALALQEAGSSVTVPLVIAGLRDGERLAQAGGAQYVRDVAGYEAFNKRQVLDHARKVRELAVRRRLIVTGQLLTARGYGGPIATADLAAWAHAEIRTVADALASTDAAYRADAVAANMLSQVQERSQAGGGVRTGRRWGFPGLDALTAGLHVELAIVGARPGMGKSSMGTAVADTVASDGDGVFLASLDSVPRETVLLRMACARAGLEVRRATVGELSPAEWSRFTAAAGELAKLPLWVDDTPATVRDLWAKCRRVQLELARRGKKLSLVVVDTVNRVRASGTGFTSRVDIVSDNLCGLGNMAKDLGVTVLGLAQIKRLNPTDKRPEISDLAESGEYERSARTIALLYREDYYAKRRRGYQPTGICEVNVAKQNDGPSGLIRLRFDAASTRFRSDVLDVPEMPTQSYTCVCGARLEAGRSCPCGKTQTPPAHASGCRCPQCDPDDTSLLPEGS